MTNALAVYERMGELQTAASAMHSSGFFKDVQSQAQAMVKVMAGAEMGLPPFASMSGIHVVQGKPVLGANLIATLVKNDPRYDYRIKQATSEACVLTWYEGGQIVGESAFTMAEANAAQLTGKDNWKKYPSDMLFARAISRGARRFAPGIFGGAPVYTPDELNVETDEDGQIVQGEVINVTPPPAPPKANGNAPKVEDDNEPGGPMPDDELSILEEVKGADFVSAAAGYLGTDTDALKARLHELGYERIPGKAGERLAAYRKLKAQGNGAIGGGSPEQAAIPLDDTDSTQAALATARGAVG